MFDIIPNLIASVLTVLFPVFASYKALRTNDPAQLQPWLMYWVSFALFTLFENYTYWLLGWLPLYGTIRLLFLLYLVLPQTQGARLAYQQYIHPYLAHHEAQIEEMIGDAHAKLQPLGLDHLGSLVELIKKYLLGMQPTPAQERQRLHEQQASMGVGGYAQSLLSRFSLPTAREGVVGSAPSAGGNDFYGLLSSATSILSRGAGGSSASQVDELRRGGDLIPSHVRTPSEKARYISSQREKLQVLMRALDHEASDHEELSRNRSEVSFDRISDDEVRERGATRRSGGGWFGLSGEDERDGPRERHGRGSGNDLAY